MKQIQIFSILTLFALFSTVSFGQTIDPTVEVSRNFDVKLGEIHKPVIPSSVDDSLHSFNISFDYSIFNRPYMDLYEFTPYQTAQIKPVQPEKNPVLYAKLGAQYPLMPSAEIYLQGVSNKGLYGSLYAKHNSFWGTMPSIASDTDLESDRMKNIAGGDVKYAWDTGELTFGANYKFDKYNFGAPKGSFGHDNRGLNINFNLNSAHAEENSLYYDISLLYANTAKMTSFTDSLSRVVTGPADSLKENLLRIKGFVGTTFDIHRVYIDLNIEYASYAGNKNHTAGVVEFSPIYEYSKGRFFGKLGVRFSSRYGIKPDGNTLADEDVIDHPSVASNVYPDVDARLALVKQKLWLHAKVEGGNDLNSFASLLWANPLVAPNSHLLFGSRPVDAQLSLESIVRGRMTFNIFSSYSLYRNKLVFTPVVNGGEPYTILPTYWDVNRFSVGAEAYWKSKDLTTGGEIRYSRYYSPDDLTITNLPALTAHYYLRYNWRERIVAGLDFRYSSEVSGDTFGPYSVPSLFDLDVNVNYFVNKHFSVFVKGGNLLNKRNQYIPLYIEPGINFGGGVCIIL